ncbi:DUF4232 domain-containing protein [Actinomadura rudentiformis]|uniref:DUF4232 domain-containing protein n=1 Tax=Actinomadura rudentiformis TaxID=359158 RepID=A0A6H9YP99_9ACTN|nr:DUF4232 domain-containing protein [Actinomadura rudentiformis]KAB2348035.1 DUF4232 domain-containing protein [Actinomadura rudentiformis]
MITEGPNDRLSARLYIGHVARVTAALILPLALVACEKTAGAPSERSERPTASAAPACPRSGVALWVRATEAAMGLRSMSVELYNCGDRDRVLKGYPQVRLLDVDRKPIKVAVGRGSSSVATVDSYNHPPRKVTLKPGEVAWAGILWRNLVTDDPQHAVTAEFLEIAPSPGEPTDRLPGVGIDLGTTRKLGVSPWEKVRNTTAASSNGPRQHPNLGPAQRLLAEMAVRKIYPALERLRTQGGFTADSVRAALLGLGYSADTTKATSIGAIQAVAFEVRPGGGACVSGTLQPDRLTTKVDSGQVAGGCATA